MLLLFPFPSLAETSLGRADTLIASGELEFSMDSTRIEDRFTSGEITIARGGRRLDSDASAHVFSGTAGILYAVGAERGGFVRAGFAFNRGVGDIEAESGDTADVESTEYGVSTAIGVYF